MIPAEIQANFNFTITVPDVADLVPVGYTPKFVIGGAASLVKSGTIGSIGDDDADDLIFDFVATDTTSFPTGQYWYQVISEDGLGGRVFISEGILFVTTKITGSGVYDGRSTAEKILEAIDNTILGKATNDQQSYVIQSGTGSRSLSRLSMTEIREARQYYATIVAAEKRNKRGQPLYKRHTFGFISE